MCITASKINYIHKGQPLNIRWKNKLKDFNLRILNISFLCSNMPAAHECVSASWYLIHILIFFIKNCCLKGPNIEQRSIIVTIKASAVLRALIDRCGKYMCHRWPQISFNCLSGRVLLYFLYSFPFMFLCVNVFMFV